ncbi:hypothetical protein DYI21_00180 [Thalassospira tepidiphila]|jgi:hypothetical protein|nr:hypothetical protein [Thalassospira tepidiphila]
MLPNLDAMAAVIDKKYKENSEVRVGIPDEEFHAGVLIYNSCPLDRSGLRHLLCRKTLKDTDLPAV